MAFTQAALTTEINTDPLSLGYAPFKTQGSDGFAAIAVLLNKTTGAGAANVFKNNIAAVDIQGALDPTEFATLTATQLNQLSVMLSGGVINSGSASVRSIIVAIFSPSASFPNTRAALAAIASRAGSRAEVLFGTGTVIAYQQVEQALGL
jgi:hypothetical protein